MLNVEDANDEAIRVGEVKDANDEAIGVGEVKGQQEREKEKKFKK